MNTTLANHDYKHYCQQDMTHAWKGRYTSTLYRLDKSIFTGEDNLDNVVSVVDDVAGAEPLGRKLGKRLSASDKIKVD